MKVIYLLCVLLLSMSVFAKATGIKFRQNFNWQDLLKEAKEKKLYIFVDCYTTWCGPCKRMNKEVFSQKMVGDSINQHFISIQLQMDTTVKDPEEVKRNYALSHLFQTKYSCSAYPDYMVFNSEGMLVHRFIGSMSVNDFLANVSKSLTQGQQSLDPEIEYHAFQKAYQNDSNNHALLRKLTYLAVKYKHEANAQIYAQKYLALEHFVLNDTNMKFIFETGRNISDTGFQIMLNHKQQFEKKLGKEPFYAGMAIKICMDEILPKISAGETKKQWDSIQVGLRQKYGLPIADAAIAQSQFYYFSFKKDWFSFASSIDGYAILPYSLAGKLNDFSTQILQKCSDTSIIRQAINWSLISYKKENSPVFLSTHAQLLYKIGYSKEAIKLQAEAVERAKKKNFEKNWGVDLKEKMKRGEAIF